MGSDLRKIAPLELAICRQWRFFCRGMHLLREETHGAAETVIAKPAEHLLCAGREEHDTERVASYAM